MFSDIQLIGKHLRLFHAPAPGAAAVPYTASTISPHPFQYAIREWTKRNNIRNVVIGVSGGIDSAVSAALYASVLPRDAITLVNLPGPFTSATTRNLAQQLADNLGIPLRILDITRGVNATRDELTAAGFNVAQPVFENIQARHRGHLLAAIAASQNGVFACNTNKTEAAVGYGTLYGDIAGWLSLLGDLWKGEVYALGRALNAQNPVIPEAVFNVKPSAELSAAQDVTQNLGDPFDYPYHDALFRAWVEHGETPETCLASWQAGTLATTLAFNGSIPFSNEAAFAADMQRWWKLHTGIGAVKRLQAPPVLAVSAKPL